MQVKQEAVDIKKAAISAANRSKRGDLDGDCNNGSETDFDTWSNGGGDLAFINVRANIPR